MSRADFPNKSEQATLRYFARGKERDRLGYWLPPDNTPPARLTKLVNGGLLRRGMPPDADCFRITKAGLGALEAA